MGGPAPETAVVPGLAPVDPIQDGAVYAVALAADSTLDAETAAELRAAADSAADAVALEQLANAAPEDDGDTTAGPDAADAVTWDIDVVTYNDHDRVQFYLNYFQTRGRERMGIWLSRLPYYEPMIREELAREGLPGDLVYLALIESGLSNTAVSRARATGMWQFMAGTARMYDLRVDGWVDERRDPYLATNAAARHLSDLRERFGSLYLAAAAYNAGAGKVSRGIRRLPEGDDEDLLTDATYFRLSDSRYLRRETRDYVPKLIAAAIIAKEPGRYGFDPPPVVDPIVWDSIIVPDATGLDVIADLADTTVAAIRSLNPKYLR
ncbi:MAG: lytic transglycosylase domain-containing protein, partial [Gemmatimonadales bacterium]